MAGQRSSRQPPIGLDPSLARALDQQLGHGDLAVDRATDAALIARVKQRVLSAIRAEAAPPHHTVRAGHGDWETVAAGVERKVLWDSGQARSWMVRLAPGAMVAAHAHPMDEECVVVQGSLRIGDLLLEAGDFHVGRQGSQHALTTSEHGALVFLRGARAEQDA